MATIEITYNAQFEIDEILTECKRFLEMSSDKDAAKSFIQNRMQKAFDEGRKFQKEHDNIPLPSPRA